MRTTLALLVACLPAFGYLYNIDMPTPTSLAHGEYYVGARLWGEGGAVARVAVGLFDHVTLGVSYGGNRFLGTGRLRVYQRPEFQARLALLQEQGYIPALLLAFESQGYDDPLGGSYATLPRGGYLLVGKTITPINTFVQVGANYWDGFNGFFAANALLPGNFEVILEYDPAFNDRRGKEWGPGYLNFGVGWTFAEKMRLGLALRDILGNRDQTRLNRVVDISVREHF